MSKLFKAKETKMGMKLQATLKSEKSGPYAAIFLQPDIRRPAMHASRL